MPAPDRDRPPDRPVNEIDQIAGIGARTAGCFAGITNGFIAMILAAGLIFMVPDGAQAAASLFIPFAGLMMVYIANQATVAAAHDFHSPRARRFIALLIAAYLLLAAIAVIGFSQADRKDDNGQASQMVERS